MDPSLPAKVKAILFDTFGTVVDWRGSLIDELTVWGKANNREADWTGLVDAWRQAYAPSMNKVRKGELPWTQLDDLHRSTLDELVVRFEVKDLSDADLDHINRGWHRLRPWPDSVPGLTRLKTRYIIGPLSNGNTGLLVNMAKAARLPWDVICAADIFGHYKPDPETYLGAAALLDLEPGQVMMAAAHNSDLKAARALGFKTCFFPRPTEYGPDQKYDLEARDSWDVIARDIADLAQQMGT